MLISQKLKCLSPVDSFTSRVRDIILQVPSGKVTTYGLIARYAGNRCGARQVSRILYSSSEKYKLPWHRVVNRLGKISPRPSMGHLFQQQLLLEEGVEFDEDGTINFAYFMWLPEWFDFYSHLDKMVKE